MIHAIVPILDRVNVTSCDDGLRFLDTTRLDAIERILREENESRGAADVITHLRATGSLPHAVIVLDITDDRFYGSPCTLENFFANGTLGLPSTDRGFLDFLQDAFARPVPSVHHDDAWADEAWRYEEEAVHVVSLCVPTAPAHPDDRGGDWMHSADGIRVRADLLPAFGESLSRLARHLAVAEEGPWGAATGPT